VGDELIWDMVDGWDGWKNLWSNMIIFELLDWDEWG